MVGHQDEKTRTAKTEFRGTAHARWQQLRALLVSYPLHYENSLRQF